MSPRKSRNYWKDVLDGIKRSRRRQGNLYNPKEIRSISRHLRKWESEELKQWLKKTAERKESFENPSGITLRRIYTPDDIFYHSYADYSGLPGANPYMRGIYPSMYRGRTWTIRMFSGYGTPEETNARLKYLLKEGETGLSIAFDMPTLYGFDADHKRAEGEVGKCGVNVSSLRDMEVILDQIPLDEVSTSMTINAPVSC